MSKRQTKKHKARTKQLPVPCALIKLPRDTLSHILSYLSVLEHFRSARVSKAFNQCLTDPLAWPRTLSLPHRIGCAAVLPRLSHLKLTQHLGVKGITDELLVNLAGMSELSSLALIGGPVGSGFAHLIPAAPRVCSLRTLEVFEANVQPEIWQYIFRMPCLHSLSIDLSAMSATDLGSALPRLSELPALRHLRLITSP